MDIILKKILEYFDLVNTFVIGPAGSAITICDHFKNRNKSHIEETYTAMRTQSKKAYDSYCEYRKYKEDIIGKPEKEDIIGYWESCLQRNTLPSISDLVAQGVVACEEEAKIIFPRLMDAWIKIPDFAAWLDDLLMQNKIDELSTTLTDLQQNVKEVSSLIKKWEEQNLKYIARPISLEQIIDAKLSCSLSDIRSYYMVNNNYYTMFRVISAGADIPRQNASQAVMNAVQDGIPVIISGNGGLGKTSLMLYTAIQWAAADNIVVWLSLSSSRVITEQQADIFFDTLTEAVPDGRKALLCIDNPFESKESLSNLQSTWRGNGKIQLIIAERTNRLTQLADSTGNYLSQWFDNAKVILLLGTKPSASKTKYASKSYDNVFTFLEEPKRRKKILSKCTSFLVEEGIITKTKEKALTKKMLNQFEISEVSLVEMIYRTLFEAKKMASKPGTIKLDWDEWYDFIQTEFGKVDSPVQLYGIIAASKILNVSLTLSLYCSCFDSNNLKEDKLKNRLKEKLMTHHIEPVIFHENDDTIQPKHDVIAELFFLFHKKITINDFIPALLNGINKYEIEELLSNIVGTEVRKHDLNGKMKKQAAGREIRKYDVGEINYWNFMNVIYRRIQKDTLHLSDTGAANLCLGFLWSNRKEHDAEDRAITAEVLTQIAPPLYDRQTFLVLYTEWGILAGELGDDLTAEEKFTAVMNLNAEDLPSRLELGKLRVRHDRKKEAEDLFWEVIRLDSKNVPARTELGMLRVKQGKLEEAEAFFQKALKIDPKNLHPHTELGKLRVKQGRQKEAEDFFRKAMRIDSEHIPSRLELARLYVNQGKTKKAQAMYEKILKIDPRHTAARRELERLYSK